jgi:hypothetical protein
VAGLSRTILQAAVWAHWVCAAWGVAAAQPSGRYTYLAGGAEVHDAATGLTWRRCVEGMVWTGTTCTGKPRLFSHEAALQWATAQSPKMNWRLPSMVELSTLVDRSRSPHGVNTQAFPANPASQFWTVSPYVGYALSARNEAGVLGHAVSYGEGYRMYTLAVRLVRSGR